MINIPKYRLDEIMKIYDIFYDKNKNNCDLKDRKIKFKKILKLYYKWLKDDEYNYIYNLIKEKEFDVFIKSKKIIIERKYKNDLIKLFGKFDTDNSNSIDLQEFKSIFSLVDENINIEKVFKELDINENNEITIDTFIIFMTKNENILKKIDMVLEKKFKINLRNDKRTLLFNNFPGSPLKANWRPSLSNLNNFNQFN
jgi:hypothetical protein